MASHTQRRLKVRIFQGSKFFMVAMRVRGRCGSITPDSCQRKDEKGVSHGEVSWRKIVNTPGARLIAARRDIDSEDRRVNGVWYTMLNKHSNGFSPVTYHERAFSVLPKGSFALPPSSSTNTCPISPSLPRQKTPIGRFGKPLSDNTRNCESRCNSGVWTARPTPETRCARRSTLNPVSLSRWLFSKQDCGESSLFGTGAIPTRAEGYVELP